MKENPFNLPALKGNKKKQYVKHIILESKLEIGKYGPLCQNLIKISNM